MVDERIDNNKDGFPEHEERYRWALQFVKGNVLDCACGTGYGANILLKKAETVLGVDISKDVIKEARMRYTAKNISFGVKDGEVMKLPDNHFDAICSFETIEHIKDYSLFLKNLRRVLKPEGTLLISTPNRKIFSLFGRPINTYHKKEFTINELEDNLRKYFDNVEMYGQIEVSNIEMLYTKFIFMIPKWLKAPIKKKSGRRFDVGIKRLRDKEPMMIIAKCCNKKGR